MPFLFPPLSDLIRDWAMDLCVLIVTQLIFGGLRLRRLLISQLLLRSCSILFYATAGRPGMAVQFAVYLACAAVLTGERRFIPVLEAALCIACAYAAAAGLAAASRQSVRLAPLGAVLPLSWAQPPDDAHHRPAQHHRLCAACPRRTGSDRGYRRLRKRKLRRGSTMQRDQPLRRADGLSVF